MEGRWKEGASVVVEAVHDMKIQVKLSEVNPASVNFECFVQTTDWTELVNLEVSLYLPSVPANRTHHRHRFKETTHLLHAIFDLRKRI
jgi:hypothetical protein